MDVQTVWNKFPIRNPKIGEGGIMAIVIKNSPTLTKRNYNIFNILTKLLYINNLHVLFNYHIIKNQKSFVFLVNSPPRHCLLLFSFSYPTLVYFEIYIYFCLLSDKK